MASTRYRPDFSTVPFTVDAKDVLVNIRLPSWDTHRTFNLDPSVEVGRVGDIAVSGSYRYYAHPSPEHQEKLKLYLSAERVAFKALGWVVRRMFCVKDNYFGTFTQFSTMQEFLEKFDHSPDSVGDPIVEKYRPGRSDSFAVNLTVNVRDSIVVMSDEIYGCDKGIAIPIPQLQLDLRNNEFQMDMALDVAPTHVVACDDLEQCYQKGALPLTKKQDVVFIEGLDIKANRLFGPQPKGTTYVCLWELSIGHISAFLTPEFKDTLAAVGSAIGYNYTDRDNAPSDVYIAKTPPDATFVKLSIQRITALLETTAAGIAVELPQGVFIDTSSVASKACRSVQGLGVPCASLHVLRRQAGHKTWEPVGSVSTGMSMDTYKVPPGWQDDAAKQQEFLREQDEITKRVPFLYGEGDDPTYGRHEHEIYVPRPRPVEATWDDEASLYTYEETYDESSSPGGSDISDPAPPSVLLSRVSRRRRAMSRARAAEVESLRHEHSSLGDESDTCSTFSASSDSSSDTSFMEEDPTTILEDKLSTFRKIHERARHLFAHESSVPSPFVQEPGDMFEPLTISDGAVQKITVRKTTVEVTPAAVQTAAVLGIALDSVVPRAEIQLDQLLAYQVGMLQKEGTPRNPKLFIINTAQAEFRFLSGPIGHPDTIVKFDITSCSSRVLSTPIVDSAKSVLQTTIAVGALDLTTYRNGAPKDSLALSDIPDVPVPTESRRNRIQPYTYARALDLGVTVNKDSENVCVQSKVTSLEVHSATPGVPVISYVLDIWSPTFKRLPTSNMPNTSEALLYDITTQAVSTGTSLSLPSFMYEASYGLHLDDQRNIRRDMGWGALQSLRYWMRQMQQHGQLHPNVIRPSGPDMAKRIVYDLAKVEEGFGLTPESVAVIPFLDKVLGKDLQAAGCSPPPVPSMVSVFTSFERAELRHYGRQLQTNAIAWSLVRLESGSVAFTNLRTWVETLPLSNVRSVISVRYIEIDLKDSSFAANEAIIRHIDTHRKEIKELKVVQTVEGASTVVLDVHLDRFAGGLTFGGMRGSTTLDHGQIAITLDRSCRNMKDCTLELKQRTCILNCTALEAMLARCPDDPRDASPVRPMITTSLTGIKAGMATNLDSRDHRLSFQRILVGLEKLDFNSRPQMKHFYEFVQDWRRDYWPLYQPYWNKFEDLFVKHKARFTPKNSPSVRPPSPGASEPQPVGQRMIDAFIGSARLQLRGSEKLWLRWNMGKIYGSFQGTPEHSMFGGKVDPQVIGGHSQEECLRDKQASIVRLPEITGTGNYEVRKDSRHLGMNISVGMFTGIIKPIVLDRLLSLHQKVGKDVTLIVRDLKQAWGPKSPKSPASAEPSQMLQIPDTRSQPPQKELEPVLPWSFDVQASIAGVRVGLRADGVPSTLMFEALDLRASASNVDRPSICWMAKANHVGLVLIRLKERGTQVDFSSSKPMEGARSASMVFDFSAEELPGDENTPSRLSISFTRVHTVMHIAALSEVSDLIKSWSADLTVLREVHRDEVEDVKEEASRVLKKIEGSHISTTSGGSQDSGATALESWFRSRVLTVEIHGFGIAIPLDEDASVDLSGRHNSDGPALLFSIRLMTLRTSRTETARFRVLQSSLSFVNGFDAGQPDHFVGDFHVTNNRMTLPKIDSEAQLTSTPQALLVTAHCQATDFKLSLTPDIADGVGKLIDMYELGKGQLEVLEKEYLSEWGRPSTADSHPESLQSKYDAQVASAPSKVVTLRTSFRFDSGLVELHRPTSSKAKRTHRSKEPAHDLVILPTVSLWIEYAGPTSQEEMARTLLFNMAVHESKNELRPTILPFFTELVGRIERRAKSRTPTAASTVDTPSPSQISVSRSPELPLLDVGERADRAMSKVEEAPTGKIRLRLTLRIDKSELKLSCTPDSNAYVDLKWESGGFVASTLLGGKHTSTLAGSVSGVTAYLSHEFAETGRGCIEAGAKDLAFSVALCSEEGNTERGLSIVVDTGISAQFQLEAFSAWLIFMSVWVDAAPKLDISNKQAPASSMTSTSAPIKSMPSTSTVQTCTASGVCQNPVRAKLGVAALIRFRSIDFDANVAVTQARLEMTPVILRTVTDGEETELDLNIGTTSIKAKGDVSGSVTSESLKFHTIRRSSRSAASFLADPTVLKMSIDAGDLRGSMFIGDMSIVRFRLEPSRVTLADNWKAHAKDSSEPVSLDFIVNAGQFTGVLKLPVIPRLLGHFYSIFDLIESQKKIAAQRSESFKHRQAKKADTGNTVVVLPSATAPSSPMTDEPQSPPIMVRTAQLMKFELKGIDIGLFVDDYDDGTVADFLRFYIGQIGAELSRSTDSEGRPERALELHVDFVEWQTSDGRRAARVETPSQTPADLIQASMKAGYKVVVVLPRMKLDMRSTQKDSHILYNFGVLWGETDGDVKVIPKYFSYALRSFQKLIRGIETQQMDRAKRAGVVDTSSAASMRRAAKSIAQVSEPAALAAAHAPESDAEATKSKSPADDHKSKDSSDDAKVKGGANGSKAKAKAKAKRSAESSKPEPSHPTDPEGVWRMSLGGLDFFDRDHSSRKVPLPKLKALGETTGDAAAFFDWFRRGEQTLDKAAEKLPAYSHRFVTLPLEDGMDMLLKLYQKQLPGLDEQESEVSRSRPGRQGSGDS